MRDGWDDAEADRAVHRERRRGSLVRPPRAQLAAALARTGPLGEVVDASSDTPADRAWTIRGEHADLRVDISLHPLDPPLVQWFDVEVAPTPTPNPCSC